MKLEVSLPERPGFLHAVPLFDLFALLLLSFILAPAMVLQSGVSVELPPSRFQLERFEDTLIVTLGPGEPTPRIHFGRDAVTMVELAARLEQLREDGAPARSLVLLKTDRGTPTGVERAVMEEIIDQGFRVALVGNTPNGEEDATPNP